MAHRKSMDPFETRAKTKAAINRYQKRMLRTELGTITSNDDESHEHGENISANDDQKMSDNESDIFSTKFSPKIKDGAPKSFLNEISQNICAASNSANQKGIEYEERAIKDEVKTAVIQETTLTDSTLNIEPTNPQHNILGDNQKIEGFISQDVMLSSNCYTSDDELQFTSDVAEPSSHDLQAALSTEAQDTEQAMDTTVDFRDHSINDFNEENVVLSPKNMESIRGLESSDRLTPSHSDNFITEDVQLLLNMTTSNSCEHVNDNNTSLKANIPEIQRGKIIVLEEFEMVLDATTGVFTKKMIEKTNFCEKKSICTSTENIQVNAKYSEAVEKDINQGANKPIEPKVQDNEDKTRRKRKTSFKKYCMDFLDTSENDDFSAGSSDKWSAQESEEESSSSENRRKSKTKKKKKNSDEKSQNITYTKSKKDNLDKLRKTKKDKGESYETIKGRIVDAKSMKLNPCLAGKCIRSCKDISEERRTSLFNYYWGLSVQRRKDWLVRCAQKVAIKRKKTKLDVSRRNVTYQYCINDGDGHRQVCQSFLMSTLDITQRHLLYTLSNEEENMAQLDKRHSNIPIKYDEEVINYAKQYIESLPAVPSHYCRHNTTRVYLPQELKNISNLYRLYLKKTVEDSKPQKLSEKMFNKLFTEEYNISFHCPKKDKCILCTKFENIENEATEEDQQKMKAHIEEKKASYARFKLHQNILDSKTLTTSFDMQKVLNTPHGESMLLYYSRKYAMYNLTFYESGTRNVACYLWGESEGKRGSQEISSCLYLYLKDVDNRGIKNLLLYCDSCCGQNRNKVVMSALNNFLKTSKHLQVIQINFLIPGHTYMPVDSVHAVIEKEVKKLIVWSPSQWPTFIEAARKRPKPYQVYLIEHTDFLDFQELTAKAFTPQTAKAVKLQKVRIVTFKKECPNEMIVKYSMKEEAEAHKFQLHQKSDDGKAKVKKGKGKGKGRGKSKVNIEESSSQNQDGTEEIELKTLYKQPQPISAAKYKDLKRLCDNGTIPKRFHAEYLNLPYNSGVPDELNGTDEEDEREL